MGAHTYTHPHTYTHTDTVPAGGDTDLLFQRPVRNSKHNRLVKSPVLHRGLEKPMILV